MWVLEQVLHPDKRPAGSCFRHSSVLDSEHESGSQVRLHLQHTMIIILMMRIPTRADFAFPAGVCQPRKYLSFVSA